ncbi:MAG TPA: alanine racemase [Acetobacteraceae bacterium]|nr:alanine racemase [Acetobacteraceae bacterium]
MGPDAAHAVLTVDLGAIVANWRLLQAKHVSAATGAVVKANGYGLGAVPVATALAAAGCRHFFVATPDEALTLRSTIPDATLVALGGLFAGAEQDFAEHGIIPALGSLAEIETWSRLAHRLDRALPAFVHFDTGMSRLGLDARECAVLAQDHDQLTGIDVRCVMSHLVSAEMPDDPLNALQRDRFVAGRARLPPAPASLMNSAGMFLGETFGFDLARPGSALYGINPAPLGNNPMRPVVTLSARVLAIREIPAGATVGYNATWTAQQPRRIATVGVGYADGWHRLHSNTGVAYFDGHPVPLVGRVSMDLTTFDITDHPAIQPGSWLELLGPHRSVDDAARDSGGFSYEVLTALGPRYHRVYSPA